MSCDKRCYEKGWKYGEISCDECPGQDSGPGVNREELQRKLDENYEKQLDEPRISRRDILNKIVDLRAELDGLFRVPAKGGICPTARQGKLMEEAAKKRPRIEAQIELLKELLGEK
jgi:hypothetical protein